MRAVSAPLPPEPPKEAPQAENTPAAASEPEERFVPAARPAAAARQRLATNEESLSDARMRQIYTQYVEAKRAAKESTAGVTYEAMAKQLRQQAEKLKASHPDRIGRLQRRHEGRQADAEADPSLTFEPAAPRANRRSPR